MTIDGCVFIPDGKKKTRYFETRVFGVMKASGLWLADPDKELFVKLKLNYHLIQPSDIILGLGDDPIIKLLEEVKSDYLMSSLLFLG